MNILNNSCEPEPEWNNLDCKVEKIKYGLQILFKGIAGAQLLLRVFALTWIYRKDITFAASVTQNEEPIKSIFMIMVSYCIDPERLALSFSLRGLLS